MPPKHRSTIFAVVRIAREPYPPTMTGAFYSLLAAEECAGKYQQEIKEKGLDDVFKFEVQSVSYYDQ